MDITTLYPHTKDLHILYVEDEIDVVQQSVELFEIFFASVTIATDGQKGFDIYKKSLENGKYFDIVITDLNMPNMNGIKMAKEILNLNPKQYISVISAQDDSSKLLKLINLGIDSFLLKPIQKKQLLHSLYKISKNIENEKISIRYHQNMVISNEQLEIEVKKRTKALKKQLYTDHLTGLKNRTALSFDFEKDKYNLLAIVDIDRLQFINDLYGTDIGNEIIKQFSNILEVYTHQYNYELYRTSGDEFSICANEESSNNFENFIQNISNFVIHLPLYIAKLNEEIYIDATIGVSLDKENLLTQADIALKFAKTNQKALVIYHESMNTLPKMKNTLIWKRKIQYALKNNKVIPVFQPIVNSNGKVIKYEALMRIIDSEVDEIKYITPCHFLDIAIATKLYNKLSYEIIKKALRRLIETDITISINLTYSDFIDPKIMNLLTDTLDNHDIGNRLIFEIVESEDIKDYKLLQKFIKKFRKYGVKIAIDDFGSGFSNFGNIIQTRPDYLKIDGSLIKNIDHDKHAQIMVKAIMNVAHELGVKVIAEYVHSKEVLEKLKEFKIDEYQGYYFFEPSIDLVYDENMA
jgi:diguanylate cyclase (GGDEF)-like protein